MVTLGMLGTISVSAQAGALAQGITPDQTLGAESSIVTPNVRVRGLPASLIQGGATRGSSLFHSFQDFNVGIGDRVYFANPAGIETILGRVTGADLTRIFGMLGVDGNASLFLINPNGILFGADARLDIAGSFVASTASRLTFGNNLEFSATTPQPAPLLTMNVQPGLQYGSTPTATITNRGHLATGQDLTLAAGNLDLQGRLLAGRDLSLQALDTLKVRDSATSAFVASAGGALTVQGDRQVDIFALSHPASGFFAGGNLVLRSANPISIDAHFRGGGNFRAEQLDGSPVGLLSLYDPVVEVAGDFVALGPYNGASLQILAGGSVFLGDVTITAPSALFNDSTVTLSDGTSLSITGTAVPILDVRAGQTAFFGTLTPGVITGSDVVVAGTITISPGGGVFLTNFNPTVPSQGRILTQAIHSPGGEVVLDSTHGITVAGVIDLSNVNGLGGDVTLLGGTGDITFTTGSGIDSTGVLGGNIRIATAGIFSATEGGIASFSLGPAPGVRGGDIQIDVGSMFLDRSIVETSTIPLALLVPGSPQVSAAADAGNISIRARDEIRLSDTSLVRGLIRSGGIGKAADVEIQTRSLFLTGGSQIGSSFFREIRDAAGNLLFPGGQGSKGKIEIHATDQIVLSGINQDGFPSGIIALTERGATGDASDVFVDIPNGLLRLEGAAAITTNTLNSGAGGNVFINAGRFELLSGSKVLANSFQSGAGGIISITASDRILIDGVDPNFANRVQQVLQYVQNNPSDTVPDVFGGVVQPNSGLYANTQTSGASGNILLNAPDITLANVGVIVTDTDGNADSGIISINAGTLSVLSGAEILARTFSAGKGGGIVVNADTILLSGVAPFPFLPDGSNLNVGGFSSGFLVNAEDGSTGQGGTLSLTANHLQIANGAVLSARTRGSGIGGNIVVDVNTLDITGGGQIIASAFDSGLPGNILINATGDINISGFDPTYDDRFDQVQQAWQFRIDNGTAPSGFTANELARFTIDPVNAASAIQARIEPGARITPSIDPNALGGFIFLTGNGSLLVNQGGLISTSTFGQGDAGNVVITLDGDAVMDAGTIASAVRGGAIGQGGTVLLNARSLSMTGASELSTSTSGLGAGGNILIQTAEDIVLSDSSNIRGTVEQGGIGQGGTLVLTGRSLTLTGGAQIQAGVFRAGPNIAGGIGNAGDIQITMTDFVDIAGFAVQPDGRFSSGLFVSTERGATGQAGNISITTDRFRIANSAIINATTENEFNAGTITINANRFEASNFGEIRSESQSSGTAGNIILNIDGDLNLQNAGRISVDGQGTGNPGNIVIHANSIFFKNGSSIDAETASGSNANINLQLQGGVFMFPRDNQISALALNNGNGGNITLNALIVLANLTDNNDVVANAFSGRGGNIVGTIGTVRQFRQFNKTIGRTPDSDFIASSVLGIDGTVNIQTQNLTEFPALPANLVDRSGLISQGCKPGAREIAGNFTVTGRGGLSSDPTQALDSETILAAWVALPENNQPIANHAQTPVKISPNEIVEAQSWIRDEQGNITLVAQAVDAVPQSAPIGVAPVCGRK
ncbi:MAG: filamentous hemagglutinin N-terminal domain-containing protein [Scytolyngbya sp. HA4215-MV1]|jgi:filamentous hemagglutinin family protein|nr:filamentous hemagglutinin N-terminal domain-containing protein [Scytolyngbya sp. HA4215-MV1]